MARPEGGSKEFLGTFDENPEMPDRFGEQAELAQIGYPEFDAEAYRNGDLTPVYFGSALKNFGVIKLIEAIAQHAPPPRPQPAGDEMIQPEGDEVTGFIFKVQANMDPNHRDRIAFMRQVSGTFKRGMKLTPSRPRQAHRHPFADPVLRAGPRDCRYGGGRRHHRHSRTTARCGWATR